MTTWPDDLVFSAFYLSEASPSDIENRLSRWINSAAFSWQDKHKVAYETETAKKVNHAIPWKQAQALDIKETLDNRGLQIVRRDERHNQRIVFQVISEETLHGP